ncbi:MAG: DNRLRE domain-containing protein [Eubacteriales bacterium]
MKNVKFILLLTLLFIISSISVVTADVELPDITDHWAEDFIRELVDIGAITGYPDGLYRPENKITRAEFASVLRGALELEEVKGETFNDTLGHWGEGRIEALIKEGVIDTDLYEENYSPDDYITREEIAMMTVRMLGVEIKATETPFLDEGAIGDGYNDYVAEAYKKEIITGYPDTTFRPAGTATRAEAAVMVIRALRIEKLDQTLPSVLVFSSEPSTITEGESSTISWQVIGADDVSIEPDIGEVGLQDSISVSPEETTQYIITASNDFGNITDELTVEVELEEEPITTAPTINFFSSDTTTMFAGGTAFLEWEVDDADKVTITPVFNEVPSSSSASVSPSETTTYTLTATNTLGSSTADLTINVFGAWTPPENGFFIPTPSISNFSTDKSIMTEGISATLSWEVEGIGTAIIEPDIGEVDLIGTISVSPTETTTYTLTAGNVTGVVNKEVEITIESEKIIQPGPKDGKDTWVSTRKKDTNYSSYDNLWIGRNFDGDVTRTLINIDVSSLPSNAVIVSSYLELYQDVVWGTENFNISTHKITTSWDLNDVTWNNPPLFNSTAESTTQIKAGKKTWLSWDIKDITQDWVNENTNNYGILLKKTNESSGETDIACWSSYNSTEPDLRPKLRIKYYVP